MDTFFRQHSWHDTYWLIYYDFAQPLLCNYDVEGENEVLYLLYSKYVRTQLHMWAWKEGNTFARRRLAVRKWGRHSSSFMVLCRCGTMHSPCNQVNMFTTLTLLLILISAMAQGSAERT